VPCIVPYNSQVFFSLNGYREFPCRHRYWHPGNNASISPDHTSRPGYSGIQSSDCLNCRNRQPIISSNHMDNLMPMDQRDNSFQKYLWLYYMICYRNRSTKEHPFVIEIFSYRMMQKNHFLPGGGSGILLFFCTEVAAKNQGRQRRCPKK
jgi:hypothetical protein